MPGSLDYGVYPGGIGSMGPNSVQNAQIRNHGNQSVNNAMQAQIITPKNFAPGGNQHGAII